MIGTSALPPRRPRRISSQGGGSVCGGSPLGCQLHGAARLCAAGGELAAAFRRCCCIGVAASRGGACACVSGMPAAAAAWGGCGFLLTVERGSAGRIRLKPVAAAARRAPVIMAQGAA